MSRNPGKILGIIFLAVITAGAIFLGLQYLSEWHEQEIQSALELQRKQYETYHTQLEQEIRDIEEQLEKNRQIASVPEEREIEVFGEPATEAEIIGQCEIQKKRIDSFFSYIDEKISTGDMDSQDLFFRMVADLADKPPLVVGETRDLITLLRNRAHFFRVLKKERIDLVRNILKTEKDILESAMADFYSYYISENRCINDEDNPFLPSFQYDYAGFFLETISGKSYLMRRDSAVRSLSVYYSVLILDQAIDNELNRYGIDIREHIDFAEDDIRSQRGLAHRERYLETLGELRRKYQ